MLRSNEVLIHDEQSIPNISIYILKQVALNTVSRLVWSKQNPDEETFEEVERLKRCEVQSEASWRNHI